MNNFDVIIVGAGGAGLSAAIEAGRLGKSVAVVTKRMYREQTNRWRYDGGCTWKTHAFNAAINPDDTVEKHIQDTLTGGGNIGNIELVKILCEGANEIIPWLEKLGVELDNYDNKYDVRPFGGNGTPRGVFKEDRLGFFIQRSLVEAVEKEGNIQVFEELRLLDLVVSDQGTVVGIYALDEHTGEVIPFMGRSVILADGAGASMYEPSAVSKDKTCDGICSALRSGAVIADMEFIQFHPTGLVSKNTYFNGSLIEESLRFDGGLLLNDYNEQFMFKYDPRGEKATRDIVSRGIYKEILAGNCSKKGSARLWIKDCTTRLSERYPAMAERLHCTGIDLDSIFEIPVRPTAHFMMGGIVIDASCQSTLPGLYAAGESATGVHGANRLGGNGLSEAIVFGRISGKSAAENQNSCFKKAVNYCDSRHFSSSASTADVHSDLRELRSLMYENCGPIRTECGLSKAKSKLDEMANNSGNYRLPLGAAGTHVAQETIDAKNLTLASMMICEAAIIRSESLGSHFRLDSNGKNKYSGTIRWSMSNDNLPQPSYSRER